MASTPGVRSGTKCLYSENKFQPVLVVIDNLDSQGSQRPLSFTKYQNNFLPQPGFELGTLSAAAHRLTH